MPATTETVKNETAQKESLFRRTLNRVKSFFAAAKDKVKSILASTKAQLNGKQPKTLSFKIALAVLTVASFGLVGAIYLAHSYGLFRKARQYMQKGYYKVRGNTEGTARIDSEMAKDKAISKHKATLLSTPEAKLKLSKKELTAEAIKALEEGNTKVVPFTAPATKQLTNHANTIQTLYRAHAARNTVAKMKAELTAEEKTAVTERAKKLSAK